MRGLLTRLLPQFSLQSYLFRRLQKEPFTRLGARRIYILPTREGVTFLITILLLLAAALNYNNSLLFIFTFMLAGIGIITMHHTHNNLLAINLKPLQSLPVFTGDSLTIPIEVTLPDDKTRPRFGLGLSTADIPDIDKEYFDVNKNKKHICKFQIKTQKRGYIACPRLTIDSRYPLGLLRAWSNLLFDKHYLVYPKPLNSLEVTARETYHHDGTGDVGKGHDEFSELREKHASDAYTHVHWKAYARSGVMLIKQYAGSHSDNLALRWDDYPQYTTEKRLSLFTRLLLDAFHANQSFSLELPGTQIALSKGESHLHNCLKALALFEE
jgi:uncharacterized protein (DUF58 family)